MAPTGSMTIPSQRNTWLMLAFGRTTRISGAITVGPVTTVTAPISAASSGGKSSSHQLARLMTRKVTSMPTVTRLRTTPPRPRISSKRSVSAPSNRMIATDSDTSGNSRSPNSRSGCTRCTVGPSTMPNSSSGKMAGRRSNQASHCASSDARPISTNMSGADNSISEIPFK